MVEVDSRQLQAVAKMRDKCILRGDVGSGKSRVSILYALLSVGAKVKLNGKGDASLPKNPLPLYIITTAKKRDSLEWEAELAKFGMTTGEDGGMWNAPITVDSWNNIQNYAKAKDSLFIFDEQRLVGSGSWVKAFYQIARKNRWYILTGTPGDDWKDYIPVFVANGWYNSKAEFLRTHAVYNTYASYPKIDRWVDTEKLSEFRDRVLVELEYAPHTKRHVITKPCEFDRELFDVVRVKRWNFLEERPIQDAAELFRLMRYVSNTDNTRLEALQAVLTASPKLIVFYNFDYELERLRAFLEKGGITYAEWNGHRHQEIPQSDQWVYLVQYTAGSEAWNCIETDTVLFYSLTYSYKAFEQSMGRIDRRNTPFGDLYYYVLRSQSEIDAAIWKTLRRKKQFNESAYYRKYLEEDKETVNECV